MNSKNKIDTLIAEYNEVKDKRDSFEEKFNNLRDKIASLLENRFDDRITVVRVSATTVKAHKRKAFKYIRI